MRKVCYEAVTVPYHRTSPLVERVVAFELYILFTMSSFLPGPIHFFALPYEIRLQIYEHALQGESEVLACSCATTLKTQPFLGKCIQPSCLRNFVREMPYPILANKQMYLESQPVAVRHSGHNPSLVVGGTKCLTTLLKNLPRQHGVIVNMTIRLTTRASWSHSISEPDCTLAPFDSLVSGLGIGTGKAYTVRTEEVCVLPDVVGTGLELLQVRVALTMRSQSTGWLALGSHVDAAKASEPDPKT